MEEEEDLQSDTKRHIEQGGGGEENVDNEIENGNCCSLIVGTFSLVRFPIRVAAIRLVELSIHSSFA